MPKFNFKIDELMLVLIVAVIAMIVSFYSKNNPQEMEAEKITAMILDEHHVSFASNGIIDESKLNQIKNMDYKDFKNSLQAKNDFCVYIEDGNGNIILAKGSPKLKDDGICME